MIVYVETNFLLELTYLQEEHESCEEILSLAERELIRLVLPAFSVVEARMSLVRQMKQRAEFHDRLAQQIRELARSKPYSDVPTASRDLISALINSGEEERGRLHAATERATRIGQVLPLTDAVITHAQVAEAELGLSPQDATVFATVMLDLGEHVVGEKCFLNRNAKDFANPDINAELEKAGCKLLTSFRAGQGFISHALGQGEQEG